MTTLFFMVGILLGAVICFLAWAINRVTRRPVEVVPVAEIKEYDGNKWGTKCTTYSAWMDSRDKLYYCGQQRTVNVRASARFYFYPSIFLIPADIAEDDEPSSYPK